METGERTRKPNWTEEQRKNTLRAKFSQVTAQCKRQALESIAQQINASFPLVLCTCEECEKRCYVFQSKMRSEIAAHKQQSAHTGDSYCICTYYEQTLLEEKRHISFKPKGLFSGGRTPPKQQTQDWAVKNKMMHLCSLFCLNAVSDYTVSFLKCKYVNWTL